MAKSILVVDYDPKRIETTTRPFAEAGYRVEVARDGVAGVEAYARLHPDLVLIEMMLPKRHGFEVCQEFRKLRPGKKTPVLILGTTQAERYRLQAIGAGASDYLVRPVPDERLLEICKNLIEHPNQDLPAQEPETAESIRLEEELPDFLKETARSAPVPAPKPAAPSAPSAPQGAASPLFGLADLSDDEISARLDALLPTETPPRPKRPDPVPPAPVQAARAVAPPAPVQAAKVVEPPAPVQAAKVVEPPAPVHIAKTVEPARPAPAKIREEAPAATVPPLAAHSERPAPRAKLPQAEPVFEPPIVETAKRRSGVPRPVLAAVGLIAVIGGWYGWRAMTSDETAAERAALDATDFAPVPGRNEPVLPAPSPVDPAPPESSSAPAFAGPKDAPVRIPAPASAPVPVSPGPRTEVPAAVPQRVAPVESPAPVAAQPTTPAPPRVAPVEPPAPGAAQPASPAPTAVDTPVVKPAVPAPAPPVAAPVEEGLALPSAIAPIGGVVAIPDAQPAPAQPRPGTVPGSIVDLAEADAPPVAASRTAPTYPPLALRMRKEGKVAVRLLVDETGYVADAVAVDASSSAEFAAEAVKAARNWRYLPAKKDGVPVKVWITEVIAFKL